MCRRTLPISFCSDFSHKFPLLLARTASRIDHGFAAREAQTSSSSLRAKT